MEKAITLHTNNNIRKVVLQLLDYLFIFLLFMSISGGFGFLAGYLAGRATERAELQKIIERWYNDPGAIDMDIDAICYLGAKYEREKK